MTSADVVLVNARVGESVAVRAGRIIAVGPFSVVRDLIDAETEVIDATGALLLPAFHDAHLHLLTLARSISRVDCRDCRSIAEICAAIRRRVRTTPPDGWIRAFGYEDTALTEMRHPTRADLDAVAPLHPVRLQHRGLHLDVLNTRALQAGALLGVESPMLERDANGQPTGRLWHAGGLLHDRLDRSDFKSISADVAQLSTTLLQRGIATVQDASVTNGAEEWELFHELADTGALRVRLFAMVGAHKLHELDEARPPSETVRRGHAKVLVDESMCDPAEVCALVESAHTAGEPVAVHAVSEADLVVALHALRAHPLPRDARAADRIEHAGVVPDALLTDLRAARVTVVGQPGLIAEQGDRYRAEFAVEQHTWLHRVGSLLAAGIPYVASSDAPVTAADPSQIISAMQARRTPAGHVLGLAERVGHAEAVAALTAAPARAVGVSDLGVLREGAVADLVLVDRDVDSDSSDAGGVRLTMQAGKVVWRR